MLIIFNNVTAINRTSSQMIVTTCRVRQLVKKPLKHLKIRYSLYKHEYNVYDNFLKQFINIFKAKIFLAQDSTSLLKLNSINPVVLAVEPEIIRRSIS